MRSVSSWTPTQSIRLTWPFVRYLALHARESSLFEGALGLGARLVDPETRIPADLAAETLREAIRLTGDTAIGLHAAELIAPEDRDVLELAARGQATLGSALEFTVRHYTLLTDAAELSLQMEGERAVLCRRSVHESACAPPVVDFALASILVFLRRYASVDESGFELELSSPRPAHVDEYGRFISGKVLFGGKRDALTMPASILRERMTPQNAVLTRAFELRAAQIAARIRVRATLVARVERLVEEHLGSSELTMEWASEKLGVSTPTLRRRLASENVTFRELTEHVRRRLAERALQTDGSISDTAFRLGFSSVSAFDRAFRRWHGVLPTEYRARANREER